MTDKPLTERSLKIVREFCETVEGVRLTIGARSVLAALLDEEAAHARRECAAECDDECRRVKGTGPEATAKRSAAARCAWRIRELGKR